MLRKIFFLFLFFGFISINAQFGENLVIIKTNQSYDSLKAGMELKVAFILKINEGWHINSNVPNDEYLIASKVELIKGGMFKFYNIEFPKAKEIKFDFSDTPVSVYEGTVSVKGTVKIPDETKKGAYKLNFEFTYQACNNASCMPPTTVKNIIDFVVVDDAAKIRENNIVTSSEVITSAPETKEEVVKPAEEESLAQKLESSGLFISLLIVFLGGLALNLTPCVYPLIPITIGYFGGQSEGKTSRLFVLGVLYVLGMAFTYSIVGVITSLSGAVFGALLQNPIVIIIIALVLIALALSMFGLYEFKLPDALVMKAGGAQSGFWGAFFMGLTMGIVAAPCIGPFVLGLVTVVGAKGDPLYGFLMFFTLAVGLGTPYLILALFSGKIKSLPRAGLWMEAIKHIFGFILVGMAIYFLQPIIPEPVKSYILPIFMIIAALYILFFDNSAKNVKGFSLFKYIISIIVLAFAVYLIIPSEKLSPEWKKFSLEAYNQSIANNEKIVIDFYADWCIPCKELDKLTFSDSKIIKESKLFTFYKVDMTQTLSEKNEKLRKKFNILGMPTVLIIDNKGNEVKRLTGFVNAEEFYDYMKLAK
ncbi:MAG: protein-disulfide reductase DsbD [bacterium]